MHKSIKIISIFLLLVISAYTIGASNFMKLIPEKKNQEKTACYFDQNLNNFNLQTSKSESNFNNLREPVSEKTNVQLENHLVSMIESEQVMLQNYIRTYIRSGDYPVRYRKTDYIFPFHYFW